MYTVSNIQHLTTSNNMQQQHKNLQDCWLNETFIDITDDRDLDDIPDDTRAQSAVSFPPSVMTDGDNWTEPPTPADSFRPITPSPEKNSCVTPATELSSNVNVHYLSRDVLDNFDRQTLADYDNLNWVKMFVGSDTEQNDNQPMSVESYDEYNYRNGPTSCSSVNPHDSESLERVKRKAVSPADEELIEIAHAKRRRLTESYSKPRLGDEFDSLNKLCTSSQTRLGDEFDSFNKLCTRNASHLNTDHTRTFCQGRSQKQRTLTARHRHSSLPDSGHLQNIGSTIHPLATLGSTLFHPSETFPVDVNGNFCAHLVTTSNNARPPSRLPPPVSSFCGADAINTPSPYPALGTDTLTSLNVDTLSSLNEDTLPSFNAETLLPIIPSRQNEALRHLDPTNQNASILHPSSGHVGHSFETSSNQLPPVTHQSPSSGHAGHSFETSSNQLPPVTHQSPSSGHAGHSFETSDMLPMADVVDVDIASIIVSGVIDSLCLTEMTTHGMENFMTHLTPAPGMVSMTLLQSSNESGYHQITDVPSDPSYLPQTSLPALGPSNHYQTPEPTPGPSYLHQTPEPSYLHQTPEPSPGPSYRHNISVETKGPNCVSPKLAVQKESSLIAQLPTDTLDPHLAETYQQACRQNSTEGLTKYILKTKILLRKNNCGPADIETNSEPQVKYEMTAEELQKSQQRKELNRLAAAKHRLSKKQRIEKNEQEYDEQLKRKHELEEMVRVHTDKKNMFISCLLNLGISVETIQNALQ